MIEIKKDWKLIVTHVALLAFVGVLIYKGKIDWVTGSIFLAAAGVVPAMVGAKRPAQDENTNPQKESGER